MCTAATYKTKNAYFGRNLDYEFSYGEETVIIPRNFPFNLREAGTLNSHYAIIGIAYVVNGDPLLYDAINEKGLGMAGLNFVGNAVYNEHVDGKDNIAQFEFLPWILGQCTTVAEAKALLAKINLRNTSYSDQLPASDLHWIISDLTGESIVVEAVAEGLKIYDNPIGILTNNPPFDKQLLQLSNYQQLSAKAPLNQLAPDYKFPVYSRGMGAIGLPGDLSSESRFAKAAFTKLHSISADDELSSNSEHRPLFLIVLKIAKTKCYPYYTTHDHFSATPQFLMRQLGSRRPPLALIPRSWYNYDYERTRDKGGRS